MEPDGHDQITTVQKWQSAANEKDIKGLLEVSDEDIEISGPRSQTYGHGHQLLVDWLSRAGLTMHTLRTFAREDTVVAEQQGVWRKLDTGEVTGEATFATRFVISRGKVTELARYDGDGSLELALEEARIGYEDEV